MFHTAVSLMYVCSLALSRGCSYIQGLFDHFNHQNHQKVSLHLAIQPTGLYIYSNPQT